MPKFNRDIIGKLKRASTKEEVDALLAEAAMFDEVSEKTKRRHQRIASKRRKELDGESERISLLKYKDPRTDFGGTIER